MSVLAKRDLTDHFVYIGVDSPAAAERFLTQAECTFDLLASSPRIGRVWASRRHRLKGVRVAAIQKFPRYLVFYRDTKDGLEVIRVLQGARGLHHALGQ
ncbi:MAG: type II toxin-antitoxin system RelE/ParE family toxin [Phycisphaerales bacterium]